MSGVVWNADSIKHTYNQLYNHARAIRQQTKFEHTTTEQIEPGFN